MRLAGEHSFFRSLGAFAFLAAEFFDLRPLRGQPVLPLLLDLVEQQPARDVTIHPLLPGILAFDLNARRPMQQHDAGGNLVHVLPAVPAAADKRFLNVHLAHAQRGHALRKLVFLFETDGERAHDAEASKPCS